MKSKINLKIRYNQYGYAIFDSDGTIVSKMFGTLEEAEQALIKLKLKYFSERYK